MTDLYRIVYRRHFQSIQIKSRGLSKTRGFSLIEIMIGMVVFTVLALGLTATALHSLRSAQLNIMKNTAYATAQGFAEQLKSVPEISLIDAIADPSGSPLPTRSIAATADSAVVRIDSPLFLDDPSATAAGQNHRRILVDLREEPGGTFSEVFMDMWFDVKIERMRTARAFLIEIDFKYEHPALNYLSLQEGAIRVVRTTGAEN